MAQARLTAPRTAPSTRSSRQPRPRSTPPRRSWQPTRRTSHQLVAGPQDEEVQAAQDAVDQATQQLALASPASDATGHRRPAGHGRPGRRSSWPEGAARRTRSFDIDQQQHVVAGCRRRSSTRPQNPYTDQDLAAAQAGGRPGAGRASTQAQLGVRDTLIIAPVDGIVFDRQVSPGALVGPTSPDRDVDPAATGRRWSTSTRRSSARSSKARPSRCRSRRIRTRPSAGRSARSRRPSIRRRAPRRCISSRPTTRVSSGRACWPRSTSSPPRKQDALLVPRSALGTNVAPNSPGQHRRHRRERAGPARSSSARTDHRLLRARSAVVWAKDRSWRPATLAG